MLAAKERRRHTGQARPRIAPPVPVRSDLPAFRKVAADMGITLMPWQEVAATYLTALDADDRHLFGEVCIVVARQNGKTELMKPFIIWALTKGLRILHIAQTRELPRLMFSAIAEGIDPSLFKKRRSKGGRMVPIWPRFAAGTEEIHLENGGMYKIAAASRGGARGLTIDLVIIDELREMETDDVIASAAPTLATSDDPLMVYLSNAGTDESVVLNGVKMRADTDPGLAYLEWSASPERADDDRIGWAEANPGMGHTLTEDYIEGRLRSYTLSGRKAIFETEHLCRWVSSMRQRLVDEFAWMACQATSLQGGKRVIMAVSMDPSGKRASAAASWKQPDGTVALKLLYDVLGDPIDTDKLGTELHKTASEIGAVMVAFDPMTDRELVKFVSKSKAVSGAEFANASGRFDLIIKSGKLRWMDAEGVTNDLTWTARKPHEQSQSFVAVRANDDRPITAALAAIRAVYLASGPPSASLKVY